MSDIEDGGIIRYTSPVDGGLGRIRCVAGLRFLVGRRDLSMDPRGRISRLKCSFDSRWIGAIVVSKTVEQETHECSGCNSPPGG